MELRRDPQLTLTRLVEAAQRAIERGAGAIVLGCTAMSFAAAALRHQKR